MDHGSEKVALAVSVCLPKATTPPMDGGEDLGRRPPDDDPTDRILKTGPHGTRVLIHLDGDDVRKAILAPPSCTPHPRALPCLLEAIALWYRSPVRVVVSAAELASWSAHGLVDALWVTVDSIHYTVEVRDPDAGRRRIEGLGSFRDLRQLALGGAR